MSIQRNTLRVAGGVAVVAACAGAIVTTTSASTEPPASSSPGAGDVPAPPEAFTACVPGNSTFRTGTDEVIDVPSPTGDLTLERRRGWTWAGDIDSSDPRFEGTHYYSFDADSYLAADGDDVASVFAEGHRIVNDEGAWSGSSYSDRFVLIGEGAYEGLTAIVGPGEGTCFFNYEGFVMEVPVPPVPATDE